MYTFSLDSVSKNESATYLRSPSLEPLSEPPSPWKLFRTHLFVFLAITTLLFVINLLTSFHTLWFIYPTICWLAFLSSHFCFCYLPSHRIVLGVHVSLFFWISSLLFFIYSQTDSTFLWPLIPISAWLLFVVFHSAYEFCPLSYNALFAVIIDLLYCLVLLLASMFVVHSILLLLAAICCLLVILVLGVYLFNLHLRDPNFVQVEMPSTVCDL
ncbi:hypothetical protein GEMRC1_011002 [Eukaryota sp. GEM-RC1]